MRIFRKISSAITKKVKISFQIKTSISLLCLNRVAGNLRNKQPTKTMPAGAYEEHCLISYKSTRSKLNTLSCLVLNWASSRWVCGCVLHGLSCWLARLLGYKHNQTFHERKISQTLSERKSLLKKSYAPTFNLHLQKVYNHVH